MSVSLLQKYKPPDMFCQVHKRVWRLDSVSISGYLINSVHHDYVFKAFCVYISALFCGKQTWVMKTEGKESHIYRLHSVCMHAYLFSRVQFFATSWTVAHQAPLSMGFFSGKNSGMGFHFLLQGIFPTQGSNLPLLCLLHCRQIFHPLSHWKSPFYVSALNFF